MAILVPAETSPELSSKAKDAYMLREKGYSAEDIANISGMYPGYNTYLEYIIPDVIPSMNKDQENRQMVPLSNLNFKQILDLRPDLASLHAGYSEKDASYFPESNVGGFFMDARNNQNPVKKDIILAKDKKHSLDPNLVGHELRHALDKDKIHKEDDFYNWKQDYAKRPGEIVANISGNVAPMLGLKSTIDHMREAYKYGLPSDIYEAKASGKKGSESIEKKMLKAYDYILDTKLPEKVKRALVSDKMYFDMKEQRR